MTTALTLRATKGSALTHNEMDTNLTNLQTTADDALAATATLTADKAEATALGVANTDQNMGSFTGTTIPDNVSAKAGMQALETAVEARTNTVTTRSALAALTGGNRTSAVLTEEGREGTFRWDTSDLSASVTADTAQAIYVAPTSDTTGASGAWVRVFDGPVSIKWFGALNDGLSGSSATNSTALNAFGVWARAESTAGRGVYAYAPAGIYYYSSVTSANCIRGISFLHFEGAGKYATKFIQTGAGQAWPQSADALVYTNSSNPKISTALKNATTVTAITPSELSQYSVGEMVMIGALNIQYNGYPPNLYCFDFVTISTIDTGTGVMTFTPALEYDYLSTFPEYQAGEATLYGAPRIFKLDRNGYSWNVEHVFEGFDARNNGDAGTSYLTPTGKKITFRDCVVPGFAESICQDFQAVGCDERLHPEPDKLVKKSVRRDCELLVTMPFQSASVDLAVLENCRTKLLSIGGKNMVVRDCDIDQLGYGGNLGFNSDTLFENCRVRSASSSASTLYPYLNTNTRQNYVDGVNVTYATGVFTVLKNTLSGLANGGGIASWNVVPGQILQFCRGTAGDLTTAGSHLASDLGTGIVLNVEEGVGAIVITTTLDSAAVPAWSSGQVYIKRRNPPVFRNCTGNSAVRMGSEADKAGKIFGEYFRYQFAGKDVTTNSIVLPGRSGKLVRFYANVIKPLTGTAGGKVTFTDLTAYTASTMATPVNYHIDLDLTVAGIREFTTAGLVGNVGNDLVQYNAVTQTELVLDAWCETGMQGMAYNYAPSSKTLSDMPIYEVIFEFDVGLLGKRLTMKTTDAGQILIGVSGDIA